jgi:hypothetical protein
MALILLLGVGAGEVASAPVKAATPEAAFDAFRQAAANKDFKGMVALMTPELTDKIFEKVLPGAILVAGLSESLGEDGKKKAKAIYDILEKHGLRQDDLKKAMKDKKGGALKELAAKAKDKPGLITEVIDVLQKDQKETEATKARDKEEREAVLTTRLKDVRVTGDTATATLVHKKLNRKTRKREEKEDPIQFKKVGGNWRINNFPLD